uniref:Peroxisomal membrane protein MPV17 n=1 Tax=Amphora coffeiformis TaxID=265554 RepID=A0A7S3L6N3_9STRA|mmetsp:Transcript_11505/g.23458  ORF Transcript_11505/g.23458 Transcript_11505/m.23458 type:complete len:232 (-) Transcript_11505:144-839(-)|eukprot:scaffold30655_cov151-Amphora_coffeaeformis.AAC.1
MKLAATLFLSFSFAVSAFGVSSDPAFAKKAAVVKPSAFHKDKAIGSPLFRDPALVRGGAVPGWAAYNQALDEKPLLTKAMTSLVGWALGDLLAQIFISGGPFNMQRFLSLSFFGFIYHGPSGHYFYNWLDSKITGKESKDVALKVAIDQICWCPIFMTVFFTYLGLVNGDSFSTIGNKIKTDLLSACQGSWKVWPIVHAVNFKFISNKHRLLFLNAVQIAFNMFLSLIGSK